jgi:hypothetical protein
MKQETDLSYLSAMYYTAAALLVLTAAFAGLSHNYVLAAVWFLLGAGIFAFRLVTSRKRDNNQ